MVAVTLVLVIPLLTRILGVSVTSLGGSSIHLSVPLAKALKEITTGIQKLTQQVDSLAGVALQKRWDLDLLTSYAGGICVYLKEECCFYIHHTGSVVTHSDIANELITSIENSQTGEHP